MPSPSDPRRGVFILLLLVVAIGGSLTLYAVRAPRLQGGGLFAPISREGALVLNNLLLATGGGDGVPRHALSAVPRRRRRTEAVGRLPVLQPHLRAADGAAAARGRGRAAAGVEARRSAAARCSGCGSAFAAALLVGAGRPLSSRSGGPIAGGARAWPRGLGVRRRADRMGRARPAVPRAARRDVGAARATCRAPPTA